MPIAAIYIEIFVVDLSIIHVQNNNNSAGCFKAVLA